MKWSLARRESRRAGPDSFLLRGSVFRDIEFKSLTAVDADTERSKIQRQVFSLFVGVLSAASHVDRGYEHFFHRDHKPALREGEFRQMLARCNLTDNFRVQAIGVPGSGDATRRAS